MLNAKKVDTEQLSIAFKPSTLAQSISTALELNSSKYTGLLKPGCSFARGFSDRFLSVSPKATTVQREIPVGKRAPFGQRLLFFCVILSFA